MSIHVVFVCLGNICRSPAAQGIFEQRVRAAGLDSQITTDSCGTAAFNVGKSPDPRSVAAAAKAGYDIAAQIARQIDDSDFERAHYLIAMDRMNLTNIQAWAPADFTGEIGLFMDYHQHGGHSQIPDPFYDDEKQFDKTIVLLEKATDGLLAYIKQKHEL